MLFFDSALGTLLALGTLPLIFFGVLICALTITVTIDRNGYDEEPKWMVIVVGAVLATIYGFFTSGTAVFSHALTTVQQEILWAPLLKYVGIGLLYSIAEFMITVHRSARQSADLFKEHVQDFNRTRTLKALPTFEDMQADVKLRGAKSSLFTELDELLARAAQRISNNLGRVIKIKKSDDSTTLEPQIDKIKLAEHISTWTLLWPFYLLSMVLGDILSNVFTAMANTIAALSGRFVKAYFASAFDRKVPANKPEADPFYDFTHTKL